ncbi:GNAT family N-acetyltransferase [Cohaesibacter gelatinilyticus]|uniref:Acetyltransferase involved in cellulose biosynthesis, CelD/BcsL family n=1 Tax=Cohaesibacter gelatinilyticus TaxID=372072 RepID=A0A285PDA3_9HYPH|nr:GNAT family N-acetyltransferase [Cohaesibacter gelatinilyticus]SNZ19692.1 Acetyltransferase involved in cellulose biosynthesis, CelD/BcsL family [Cohaesibacter gelatinilyticus]
MFEITLHNELDFLSETYQDLYNRSNATAFQHPIWMSAMQKKLCKSLSFEPVTLVVKTVKEGLLVALLPLVQKRLGPFRILEYSNFGVVDHACAIVDRDFHDELMNWSELPDMVDNALGAYDLLWIKHVRHQELWLSTFFGKQIVIKEAGFGTYATELGDNYQTWKQNKLSANRRSDLRRKRGKLEQAGSLELRIASQADEIDRLFDFLRTVRADRFTGADGKDFLQNPLFFDFYKQLAQTHSVHGYPVTAGLFLDGAIVAAAFGIKDGGTFKFLLPGADYKRFGRFSPGKVLIDLMIERLMDKGVTCFDLSVGDEDYKASFGTKPENIYTLRASKSVAGWAGLKLIDVIKRLRASGDPLSG